MPVRNGEEYLAEAIESVLAQSGVDLTVAVIDNCSTDGSVELARRYTTDERVRVDVNEHDIGYYGSLNRALAATSAEFFVPFACDDIMRAGNLQAKAEVLQRTGAGFVHSTATEIDSAGNTLGLSVDHRFTAPVLAAPAAFADIARENPINCQSVVARTDALRAIGGFDARSHFASDWLTWMRLALRHPVAALGEPLIARRTHQATGTATGRRSGDHGRDLPATLERALSDERVPESWRGPWRDRILARMFASTAVMLHHDGLHRVIDGWGAYMVMGRAVLRQPNDPAMRDAYLTLVRASGLTTPDIPFDAVAIAPVDAGEAGKLAATVAELAPLLARLTIAVPAEQVDTTLHLLEPHFGQTALEVGLMPTNDWGELLVPGRLAVVPWGSPEVEISESAGLPVHPIDLPNRFDRAPDGSRWETVDAAACLP